jgi:hypothetical protein
LRSLLSSLFYRHMPPSLSLRLIRMRLL